MNVRNRNIIFVIVLLFVVSALAESNIGLEFKIGSSIKDDILPLGFSGRLNFPIEKSNLKWGFDAGLVIISNWEDTLDLRNSDTPSDTLTYDYWTNTGTDLVLPLGVNFAYNMDFNQDFELIFEVGLGPLFRISSYTDIKSANDPPPKREISVTVFIFPKLGLTSLHF